MKPTEQKRFDKLYQQHLRALKLHGYSASTIDVYARAVRRITEYFDCIPDRLSIDQLEGYFSDLVDTHSWSTVRVDRNGLQFFWKHILKLDWEWLKIIKPPQVRTLPDVLTPSELEQLIGVARKLRYRVFVLTTYSMGLRLSEALSLQLSDIDSARMLVHVRRGKGHKDRFVPLPNRTYQALKALWRKHRNPQLLFPSAVGSPERIQQTTTPMDKGGTQQAVKAMVDECGIKKRSQSTRCATALLPICWSRVSRVRHL